MFRLPSAKVAAFIALIAVLLGRSLSYKWRPLSKTLGWGAFDEEGRPFDPWDNLRYCQRHKVVVRVPNGSSVRTIDKKINDELRKLARRNPPGGTVQLEAGVYYLRDKIWMPSYTCLFGSGMYNTTLRLIDDAPTFSNAGMVRSNDSERITVQHLTIDGNKDGQTSQDLEGRAYGRFGFFTKLTNYVYVYRVRVENHQGYGFDPHGSKKHWAYFLILEDCRAVNNGLDGFTLDQTFYVLLKNSKGVGNYRHGVNVVTGTKYCRIEKNEMVENGYVSGVGCSMMVQNNQNYSTSHITITGNRVVDGRKAGFCLSDVHNIKIRKSRIDNSHSKSVCYYMDRSRKIAISSSTCKITRKKEIRTRWNRSEYRISD